MARVTVGSLLVGPGKQLDVVAGKALGPSERGCREPAVRDA